jgi:uncharacterized protein with LGFP repeats
MIGAGKSMSSWDPVAMYVAGMGLGSLFSNSATGSVVVEPDGGDHWVTSPNKGQHYLISKASNSTIGADVEKLMDQLPATPPSSDPVAAYYQKLGGANSFLGKPVGNEYAPTPGGKAQNYQNGAIYWTSRTGAHVVHGAFLAKYRQLGGPAGLLGYPIMDEAAVSDRIGQYIRFSRSGGAYLYWTPRTGAHAVYGAILAEYLRLHGPTSTLGYPITDENPAAGGRYNHFSRPGGASIYWSPGSGAHAIYGAIRGTWAALGWERGRLGYPITNEYGIPSGRQNDFQHGWITWQRSNGVIRVGYRR